MKEAIQLITQLALAKHAAGELTDDELRDVLAECVKAAHEAGVLPPCFERRA